MNLLSKMTDIAKDININYKNKNCKKIKNYLDDYRLAKAAKQKAYLQRRAEKMVIPKPVPSAKGSSMGAKVKRKEEAERQQTEKEI